jgi:Xaa-Pro dipeptidase
MAERGLDALLLTTEFNVQYFTGFFTPFWQSPTRPWFVVLPASGDPIAVIPSIGEATMAETWVSDIRTWSAPCPGDDGISLLTEALTEVSGTTNQIGVPFGHETHLRMPLADFQRLKENLVQLEFVDGTEIVRTMRMTKSSSEIRKISHICSIVSASFEGIGDLVSVGMTEREAFKAFKLDLLKRGADDVPYLVGSTGPYFENVIKQPSDRTIEAGDLIMFDTGSKWDGYSSDFDRYFSFGEASDGAKAAYEIVWNATQAGLEMLKPGVTTSELWKAMADVLTAGGSQGNSVGRLGHGLGMQVTEWPSNTETDGTVITEGMVLTLEPGMSWAPGHMMLHEENVVVETSGARLLSSRAPQHLPSI